VLQNTFIKVYRNISTFKAESSLYTWLYRIATNESLSFLKKKAKYLHLEGEALTQLLIDNLEADVYFEGDEIQRRLQHALAQLPEKQRLVFNMKYFDSMSYQEISDILDVSVGGLKANYHHAVKKIEQYLKTN
jgi:RNA polymerase sigma-70 factor (ECF subfamily)